MKKPQLVTFPLALALALAVMALPSIMGCSAPVQEPAAGTEQVDDDKDATENQDVDEAPLSKTEAEREAANAEPDLNPDPEPEAEPSPEPESTPEPEPAPEPEPDPTPSAKTYDLGPDLELNEGITDARLEQAIAAESIRVTKKGTYTTKVEVALYIHKYGHVPSNYITKTKARNAGWESTKGNLWDVCPGMSIGGGGYVNEQWDDEPLLPETPEGRDWRECDINYEGGFRGAERLVYSDDGLVFYTGDHYTTFERLY